MAVKDKLTEGEMEVVMSVFRQYETGLRKACIDVKVNKIKIRKILRRESILFFPGLAPCPGVPWPEHHGAGGDRHDQHLG